MENLPVSSFQPGSVPLGGRPFRRPIRSRFERRRGLAAWQALLVLILSWGTLWGQLPATTEPGSPNPVSLRELIEEALAYNPGILAARRSVDARRAQVRSEGTLPDPVVRFQTMGNLIPPSLQSGDPSSARQLSFEQEIPYPGKLALKGQMARAEAEALWWSYEQTRLEVISQMKEAYFELWLVYESLDSLERTKSLLESFARIAETRYQVGLGSQQDLLRAQVEISRILDRRTLLQLRRELAEARINNLRFRPPETPLGRPEPLKKVPLEHSLEELYQVASSSSPALKQEEREIDQREYAVQLARKEFWPDFSVGFSYFNRSAVPEMYGLMIGARVPLYFWRKQRPELEGVTSGLLSAKKRREETQSLLYYKLKEEHASAAAAERLLELYETGLIPQARLSLESAIANYQVGKVDFLTVIDGVETLLEYELKVQESLADYQKAVARLEGLAAIGLSE